MAGIVLARRGCRAAASALQSGNPKLWSAFLEKNTYATDTFIGSSYHGRRIPCTYGFSGAAANFGRSIADGTTSAVNGLALINAAGAHGATAWNRPFPSLLSAVKAQFGCYFELSKARLSLLVVTTASTGYVLGSPASVDMAGLLWTSLGTMMAAASANSLNQIIEIRNDAAMKRTMKRPLPSGRMSRSHALVWAISVGACGISLLAYKSNDLTAALGAANIGLYAFVYTPLKQLHPVNTWVGALVGALPPLMGWSAAAGQLDPGAYVLASALFFWQIPHFMALAWLCRKDYAAGGYKMLSLADATGRRTAAAALRNSLYLAPLGFLAVHWGTTSSAFAYENLALTAAMTAASIAFYRNPSSQSARTLFRSSLLYLPLLMTAMLIHRNPNFSSLTLKKDHSVKPGLSLQLKENAEEREDESSETMRSGREVRAKHAGIDWRGQLPSNHPLPPVAFMSAAPFPFLPIPEYGSR